MRWRAHGGLATLAALALAACDGAGAGSADEAAAGDERDDVALAEFPDRPYWGDTHLHTDLSVDAFGFGVRLGPEDALKFARGDEVTATTGMAARLDRPLDFLVISDHSDAMGATRRLYDTPRILVRDPTLRRWYDMMHQGPEQSTRAVGELITAAADDAIPAALRDPERQAKATRELWDSHLDLLERYNDPGTFTAFAGFEWTLMPGGNNLHRVVMFRDGRERTRQVVPFPGLDTETGQLWDYMEAYEAATGGRVLAIPHNSNLSNGMMFELVGPDGGPMSAAHARRRARWEPVVEATQIKGDSETHPLLSPNDEFAAFGAAGWDLGNLPLTEKTTPDMLPGSYVRSALIRGLTLEQRMGVNPYAFGLVGSTDSHTALATGDEDNFFGKHTGVEPRPGRALESQNLGTSLGRFGWHYLAGGYAAAWARANTRAEIFDAFMRREVYATTGPRMVLRLFAGPDFTEQDWAGDWVRAGYDRGVPMGGELEDSGRPPVFLISALKDPEGANLDRVQVVKGWIDAQGAPQERVYDVAWSDMDGSRRKAGGAVPAVGDTVDRAAASYTNTIGAAELRATWRDPDYRPGQRAVYYVRALEIPTPSWVLFDARRYGLDLPRDVVEANVIQERAYSSPVWLRPAAVPDDAPRIMERG